MRDLIFGKDKTEKIVNITHDGEKVYIYQATGEVGIKDHIYFALTNEAYGDSDKLKGWGYYKYKTPILYTDYEDVYGRGVYKPRSPEEGYMLESGATYFNGMKFEELSLLSFDIEATTLDPNKPDADVVLISSTFKDRDGTLSKILFDIKQYEDTEQMLFAWSDWVRQKDPDILLGHNIFGYDLPYMSRFSSLNLGRDESDIKYNKKTSKFRKDGQQQYDYYNARIHGREIIDTMFLSIKYDLGRQFPSYGLKNIEKHLGLVEEDRSWDWDNWPVSKTIEDELKWEEFKDYCRDDSDSPIKLFELMAPSFFYLTQSIPKTFQQIINEATGSQIDSFMIRAYLQYGYAQPLTSQKKEFEGAISMGIPGVYENVRKVDVASLYPSIMLAYNIYPSKKDPKKYFLQSLKYFTQERLKNKRLAKETGDRYYEGLQQAQKIVINSMYGFMGANYLLYNDPEGANSVTAYGREILQKGVEWATGHRLEKIIVNKGMKSEKTEWVLGPKISEGLGYNLVNVDTDSFSYTNNLSPDLGEFNEEINNLNSLYPDSIIWENDGVFDKVIVVKAKNYIMKVGDKIKYKGSSIKDQKKEPALRQLLNESIKCILDDSLKAVPDIYLKYCLEALEIEDPSRWAVKRTITKPVLNPQRTNEQKIADALIGEKVQEGDKVWLYTALDPEDPKANILKLTKHWNNDADKWHYVKRVYNTISILSNVLPLDDFPKYHLKKQRENLEQLVDL